MHCVIKRCKAENCIANKRKVSFIQILTDRDERWMLRQVKSNLKISASKVVSDVKKYLDKNVHFETT